MTESLGHRKSLADLQTQVAEVFDSLHTDPSTPSSSSAHDDASTPRTCTSRDLPRLFKRFQASRRTRILEDDELESLERFADDNPDVEVTSDDLIGLLSVMTGRSGGPPSPIKTDVRIRSADSSDDSADESGAFGSDEEGAGNDSESEVASSLLETVPSTPSLFAEEMDATSVISDAGSSVVSSSVNQKFSTPASSVVDKSRRESFRTPLTPSPSVGSSPAASSTAEKPRLGPRRSGASTRDTPSPVLGGRTKRPLPPGKHRTRTSTGGESRSRQASEEPVGVGSPLSESSGRPMSPAATMVTTSQGSGSPETSPRAFSPFVNSAVGSAGDDVDQTSFYPTPMSPPREKSPFDDDDDEDADKVQGMTMFPSAAGGEDMRRQGSEQSNLSISSEEGRRLSQFITSGFGLGAEGTFRPDSITSLSSLPSSSSEVLHLFRHISDLEKRNKELLSELHAIGRSHDDQISEREERLEELKQELRGKTKEEKEWKAKERQKGQQITALEAEVGKLQKENQKQKEAYAGLKRQYEDQLAETQKLREIMRTKDQDMRQLEETSRAYSHDMAKWDHERREAETLVKGLEERLARAEEVHEILREQKQANLGMGETIDRLRYELDSLRDERAGGSSAGKTGGAGRGSATSSIAGSISQSLGRELAKKFGVGEEESDEGESTEEEDGTAVGRGVRAKASVDSFTEEVLVTTRRRRRHRAETDTPGEDGVRAKPVIRHLDELKEVVDRGVQSEAAPLSDGQVQTDSTPDPPPVYRPKTDERSIQTATPTVRPGLGEKLLKAIPRPRSGSDDDGDGSVDFPQWLFHPGMFVAYSAMIFYLGTVAFPSHCPTLPSVSTLYVVSEGSSPWSHGNAWPAKDGLVAATGVRAGWRHWFWVAVNGIVWPGVNTLRKVPI